MKRKKKKEKEQEKKNKSFYLLQSELARFWFTRKSFVRIRKSVMHYIVYVCFCLIALHWDINLSGHRQERVCVCVCCVSFFVSISFFGWLESRHSQNALVHVKPQNDWPMISGTETDSVEENGIEHFLFMKRSIEQAKHLPTKSSVFISFPIDYEIIKIWFFELEITTDMNETRFLGFICISLMVGSKL